MIGQILAHARVAIARAYDDRNWSLEFVYKYYISSIRVQRQDIEEEDDQESYFNYIKNAPVQAYPDDDEVEIDYDSDGNPIVPEKSKVCFSCCY